MSALGKLVVSLSANIAEFTSAMDKAAYLSEKRMDQIGRSVKAAATVVGTQIGVAAVSLGTLVKSAIDAADANSKMAQTLGISTDALTTLGYAAELSGATTDQIAKAFAKLSKNAADAAAGTGEAKGAFEAMGLEMRDSNGNLKTSETLLADIAEKFASYEDGSGKAALAMRIFGEEGVNLIPMLNSGRDGLKEMQEEARLLGASLDSDAGKAAEKFNDNMTRLSKVSQGFANQLAQALLPTITKLTDEILNAAKKSGAFDSAIRSAAGAAKLLLSIGAGIIGIFSAVGSAIGGVAAQLVALFSGEFSTAMRIGATVVEDFVGTIKNTVAAVDAIWDTAASSSESKAKKRGKKIAAPIIAAAGESKKAVELMSSLAETGVARFEAMVEDAGRVYDETRTPIEQFAARLSRLQELLDAGMFGQRQSAEAWDIYSRAVMKAQDEFDNLTKTVEDDTDIMKQYAEQAAKNIQDAFAEFLFDPFKGGVNGMLENFTVMLRKMAAQQLAAGLLKGLGNWGSTGGGQGTFIGGIVSGLFGGGKASGGPVEAGRSYLVGERGPELIHIGAQGGTVTPTEKLMGKAVTVINNFTFDRPVDRRTQEQVAAMAGGAIQTAMRRNG